MKGRTNVLNGGIILNANTVDKEIKTGNIVAGDFVQYYTESSTISYDEYMYFIGYIGDYTVVAIGNNSTKNIAILKDDVILDRYVDHEFNYQPYWAVIVENIIIFYSADGSVITLKIVNDKLTLVDIRTPSYLYSPRYVNGKFMGMETNKAYINVCDIDSEGNISEFTRSAFNFNSSDVDFKYYNGIYYVVGQGSYQGYKFELDSNNQAINIVSGQGNIDNGFSMFSQFQYGSKVLYPNSRSTIPICLHDLITGTNVQVAGIRGNTSGKPIIIQVENSHTYILTYGSPFHLYEFDPDSVTVSLIASGGSNYSESLAAAWLKNNIINATIYNSTNRKKLQVYGENIIDIPDVNYVIPYDGNINPIGVAKESGTAGDTIAVYVPTA